MPDVEIRPFSDEHLDAAAAMLAERHERHLAAEPLLARDVDFRAQVERDFTAERASGAVAVAGGELVGYLVGRMTEDDDSLVDFAGFAARDAEVIRDLYAHVAQPWVDAGVVRHRAHVPATDVAAIDAWFRLAFGRQLTFGACEIGPTARSPHDVMVRPAREGELEEAAALGSQMHQHHRRPPSFSGRRTVTDDEYRQWWLDSWNKPEFVHFVAERAGRLVGQLLLYRRPAEDLRVPADSIDLAHAVTLHDERGSGVGLALTEHAFAWAREAGFAAMTVDWREVNLLASRFWPRRGFRPTFYRLYRHVP
jgi:GNAT superfamily N-acetyltransferase